jgi:hypothetical protein
MATTFSSNIGSSSKGGFSAYAVTTDDYVTAFFADMVTGEVTNASGGEEVYATTFSANQLAALSTNLKGLLAAAVASGANPLLNPLAYLRKLAGFVALSDGQVLTYAVGNISGNVYEFYIELATTPQTVMMYIPNSAAAGLFTGSGSDEVSVPPPIVPTTQTCDYFTYIPGLYLPGVPAMTASGLNDVPVTIGAVGDSLGFAEAVAFGDATFVVEKFAIQTPPVAVGAGTKLFDVRFPAGEAVAVIENVAVNLTIDGDTGIRIINPIAGDATLAGVTIRIAATCPLI